MNWIIIWLIVTLFFTGLSILSGYKTREEWDKWRKSKIELTPREVKNSIFQSMQNSAGGTQIAGDLNVDTGRRIKGTFAESLKNELAKARYVITVGVLGTGGEPEQLANDFLQIAQKSGCETKGIFHGIGFQSFEGVQIKYSPEKTSSGSIQSITRILGQAKIDFSIDEDVSQPANSIYIYVGYKP